MPDSREGWAEAIELLEVMAYQKVFRDDLLVLDFSGVRERNALIMGMQGRPSSGPVPLMNAIEKIAKVKGAGLKPWKQTLYIDHYLAEPVLVGGARRAARMSTKHWSDPDAIEFIEVKRPVEYDGLSMDEATEFRKDFMAKNGYAPMAFLWSSNNSITTDEEFLRRRDLDKDHTDYQTPLSRHARAVAKRVAECSYADGTGEPGFINEHLLTKNDTGTDAEAYRRGDYVGSNRYQVKDETRMLLQRVDKIVRKKNNAYIVNPCGGSMAVHPDTDILTVDGPRLAGSLISRPSEIEGGLAIRLVVGTTEPLFNVVTDRGYEICAGASHRLLRTSGKLRQWSAIRDLQIDDKIVLANHRSTVVDRADPQFIEGWIVGHIKGDGGHNPNKSGGTYLRFWAMEDEPLIDRAVWFARRLGVRSDFDPNRHGDIVTVKTAALEAFVGDFLAPLSKDIQRPLIESAVPFVAGFIQGFFDTDGSVQGDSTKGRSVRLNQSHRPSLRIVQQMLLRFGIASSIYSRHPEREKPMPDGQGGLKPYNTKENWELVISKDNIERFADVISLFQPTKLAALQSRLSVLTRRPYAEPFTAKVISVRRLDDGPTLICDSGGMPYDAGGFLSLDVIPASRQRRL